MRKGICLVLCLVLAFSALGVVHAEEDIMLCYEYVGSLNASLSMPKITLHYFMSNTKGMRTGGTSQPTRTEVYEWSGEEYVLTKVYSY